MIVSQPCDYNNWSLSRVYLRPQVADRPVFYIQNLPYFYSFANLTKSLKHPVRTMLPTNNICHMLVLVQLSAITWCEVQGIFWFLHIFQKLLLLTCCSSTCVQMFTTHLDLVITSCSKSDSICAALNGKLVTNHGLVTSCSCS